MMDELPIKVEGIIYILESHIPRYLLIKRTPDDGDFWQPVTGTVHDGEKLLDCLRREVREETGLVDLKQISSCLYRFDWQRKSGERILEFVYAVEVSKDAKVILNPEEHDDFKWCDYDEALATLFTDNNKKSLEIVNNYLTKQEKA